MELACGEKGEVGMEGGSMVYSRWLCAAIFFLCIRSPSALFCSRRILVTLPRTAAAAEAAHAVQH